MAKKTFILHLKIGIIKDLHMRGLLTKAQMEQAVAKLVGSEGRSMKNREAH
jgi:hypothetical protein